MNNLFGDILSLQWHKKILKSLAWHNNTTFITEHTGTYIEKCRLRQIACGIKYIKYHKKLIYKWYKRECTCLLLHKTRAVNSVDILEHDQRSVKCWQIKLATQHVDSEGSLKDVWWRLLTFMPQLFSLSNILSITDTFLVFSPIYIASRISTYCNITLVRNRNII